MGCSLTNFGRNRHVSCISLVAHDSCDLSWDGLWELSTKRASKLRCAFRPEEIKSWVWTADCRIWDVRNTPYEDIDDTFAVNKELVLLISFDMDLAQLGWWILSAGWYQAESKRLNTYSMQMYACLMTYVSSIHIDLMIWQLYVWKESYHIWPLIEGNPASAYTGADLILKQKHDVCVCVCHVFGFAHEVSIYHVAKNYERLSPELNFTWVPNHLNQATET